MVEMHLGFDGDVEDQPGTEHAGKDDPHNRILLDAAVIFQVSGGDRAEQTGNECAQRQRQPHHPGQHDAGKHRMAHGVAHQRPALEHQKNRQQRAGHGDQE